jgi:hypothetical protein
MVFPNYKNFEINEAGWGEAKIIDIVKVLESVISSLYKNLDHKLIPKSSVIIINSETVFPPIDHPVIFNRGAYKEILLHTKNNQWAQFSYQFAHELCHSVIGIHQTYLTDKFGWFEESFCELSSLFCICKMSKTWQTKPPYENWKNYSHVLKAYYEQIIFDSKFVIDKDFKIWFEENLTLLFNDRYQRNLNTIIAIRLFDLFIKDSECWESIQYLKHIKVTHEMDLINYFDSWRSFAPYRIKDKIDKIFNLFYTN